MKRLLSFGFAIALIASAFSACTLDFNQFQPAGSGGGGTGGGSGAGGTGGTTCAGECCAPDDCTPPTDACKQSTCIANVCGEEPRSDGTQIAMQTAGDCKKSVCQGGAVASVNDDGDEPDDGNDCTTDACDGGNPSSLPADLAAPCVSNGGQVCDGNGACVKCLDDTNCTADAPSCDLNSHTCVPADCTDGKKNGAETDLDCGGAVCTPCDDNLVCTVASDCKSLVCGQDGHCTPPACDDGVKNGSEGDVDCGADCGTKCGPDDGCNIDGDCAGQDCTGIAGTCVPNCGDGVTNNDETDDDCGGGTCGKCDVGQSCNGDDGNCKSDLCGAGDLCEMKSPTGAACMQGGQCMSNQCVDGVCCNNNCNGTCKSCAVPGQLGSCQNVPTGQDPDAECNGASVCSNGACTKAQGAACGGGGECTSGNCADGFCCDMACSGPCKACSAAKTGGANGTCGNVSAATDPDNECPGALNCIAGGTCAPLIAQGAACAAGAECATANCVDGVCCNTACNGLCMACLTAKTGGTNGTCANVTIGTDPDNECNAATPNCAAAGLCGP